MSLFSRHIAFLYLRLFLLIFISLEIFFVAVDFLKYIDNLPPSANTIVLAIAYNFAYASGFILPLSLVLAQIALISTLLQSSQLTAFLALGYSKTQILKPIWLCAAFISAIFIALNCTPFAYAKDRAESLMKRSSLSVQRQNIFVKYDNFYIYFGSILPNQKLARNIQIYEFSSQNADILRIISAQSAEFIGSSWLLQKAKIKQIKKNPALGDFAIEEYESADFTTLAGFKPEILDNIYEQASSVSSIDALQAALLLSSQGFPTDKLRAAFYELAIFPLFAPLCMLLLGARVPNSPRYTSVAFLAFSQIIIFLLIWGICFSFSQMSRSGFLPPEIGSFLPFSVLLFACILELKRIYKGH